jgi:hypothetical protein
MSAFWLAIMLWEYIFFSFSVVAVGYFVTGLLFKVGSRAGQIIRSGFKPGFKYRISKPYKILIHECLLSIGAWIPKIISLAHAYSTQSLALVQTGQVYLASIQKWWIVYV